MFRRHWCQSCARCGELTPHSARRVSAPAVGAASLAIGAVIAGADGHRAAAIALAAVALLAFGADRRSGAPIRCERCRRKHQVESRRTACDPRDPNTIIDF